MPDGGAQHQAELSGSRVVGSVEVQVDDGVRRWRVAVAKAWTLHRNRNAEADVTWRGSRVGDLEHKTVDLLLETISLKSTTIRHHARRRRRQT